MESKGYQTESGLISVQQLGNGFYVFAEQHIFRVIGDTLLSIGDGRLFQFFKSMPPITGAIFEVPEYSHAELVFFDATPNTVLFFCTHSRPAPVTYEVRNKGGIVEIQVQLPRLGMVVIHSFGVFLIIQVGAKKQLVIMSKRVNREASQATLNKNPG